jgi:hypothetical protein
LESAFSIFSGLRAPTTTTEFPKIRDDELTSYSYDTCTVCTVLYVPSVLVMALDPVSLPGAAEDGPPAGTELAGELPGNAGKFPLGKVDGNCGYWVGNCGKLAGY